MRYNRFLTARLAGLGRIAVVLDSRITGDGSNPNLRLAKMSILDWRVVVAAALVWCTAACDHRVSDALIIEKYRTAVCIPFSPDPKISPHTREWDATLTLTDGTRVVVSGAEIPGGRIDLRYPVTNRTSAAVSAGDYVYPSDVRINRRSDVLYAKATGLAGGIRQQTWLFEYDIRAQRLVARQQVVDAALPAECHEPASGQ